jgi:hypothetical protein
VENNESPVVNRVAKTVRSVMTRLHAEISRSISFYRGQQNGSRPSLLLLTGGSAVIPETDTFLREKLGLRVEYLNPFQTVSVSSGISSDDVAAKMHLLGEVTGLALRKAFTCPMEINLLPPELVSRSKFKSRLPFLAASVGALLLALTCWWGYCSRLRLLAQSNLTSVETRLAALLKTQAEIDLLTEQKAGTGNKVAGLLNLVDLRMRWIEMIADIRGCLLDGMWLTSIDPVFSVADGPINEIELKGMGFVDKVKDAEAVGEFGNALKKTRYFSDVQVLKIMPPSEFGLEFSLSLKLKEPLVF